MRFSIGIPAFKSSYLKECINSVLNQSITEFELIIVNDDSPEDIESIVNSFSDPRIRYFKNEKNIGAEHVVDNWNICLSHANGEYFLLMGDDDVLEFSFLEEFERLISRFPLKDVYHCRSYIINENSEKIGITPSWPDIESVYENIWHRLSGFREQFISDFLYRTKALKSDGGFYKLPLAWGSDDVTSFKMSFENGIAHTNAPVFNYRRSAITISSSGNLLLKKKALSSEINWIKNAMEVEPDNFRDILFRSLINGALEKYFTKKSTFEVSDYYSTKPICKSLEIITLSETSLKVKVFAFAKVLLSKII